MDLVQDTLRLLDALQLTTSRWSAPLSAASDATADAAGDDVAAAARRHLEGDGSVPLYDEQGIYEGTLAKWRRLPLS